MPAPKKTISGNKEVSMEDKNIFKVLQLMKLSFILLLDIASIKYRGKFLECIKVIDNAIQQNIKIEQFELMANQLKIIIEKPMTVLKEGGITSFLPGKERIIDVKNGNHVDVSIDDINDFINKSKSNIEKCLTIIQEENNKIIIKHASTKGK